jgi:hypothetical protein
VTGTTITLRLRDLSGRPRAVQFTDHGPFGSPGSALQQRLVSTGGNSFVLKSVPRAEGSRNRYLFDLLDNEIRAGAHLGYVYGPHYPPELARLVGYNMDVEEPFAVLHAYAGKPVPEMSGLDDHRRRQLQVGLLRALQLTAAAGVVHGAVTLRSLWWSGAGVQLVDFESAQFAGEPRRTGHEPGPVDVRDDVLLAGRVIRQLVMGEASTLADHGHDPESLRILLQDVYQPVGHRPYAEDLLRRLKAPVTAPPVTDPEAALAEGRRIFDALCAPAHPPAAVVGGVGDHGIVPPRPVPARKRGVWRRSLGPMLLAAMAGRVGPR